MLYVASRASLAARPAMWQALRSAGWPIISTWIDETGENETEDFGELWTRIEAEIAKAQGVLLFAAESDFPLKGAFIECGIALGLRKRVAVVLTFTPAGRTFKPVGSWICHPRVRVCQSVEEGRAWVEGAVTASVEERLTGEELFRHYDEAMRLETGVGVSTWNGLPEEFRRVWGRLASEMWQEGWA